MMSWDIDVPDLPFKKPRELEQLEEMGLDQREAMDPYEREIRIQNVADSLVRAYVKNKGRDGDACLAMVASALEEMGASFGGSFGKTMIAQCERATRQACEEYFPDVA